MTDKFKPGEKCPESGQYKIVPDGSERTVVKGEPFPPTPKPNQDYVLEDRTKTKPNK